MLPESNGCNVASVSNRSMSSVIAKKRLLLNLFEVIIDNNLHLVENLLGVIGIDDGNMYKILTVSGLEVKARRATGATSLCLEGYRTWEEVGLRVTVKIKRMVDCKFHEFLRESFLYGLRAHA